MMAVAPASASISAEISPVWAPDGLGWQSCAPTARVFEPRARSAKSAISVAGGQTSRSALAATSGAPASMASNSPLEDLSPFIFQLPAISGRMASIIAGFPGKFWVKHALAEPGGEFQIAPLAVPEPPTASTGERAGADGPVLTALAPQPPHIGISCFDALCKTPLIAQRGCSQSIPQSQA